MDSNVQFMRRALELAECGRGQVSPNPMVGCVIVHDNLIIGEGYHQQYGGPHAEPNAVHSVVHPELLQEATVYVTLEPCAHFGKTPPCAQLLIEKQVKKVVVAVKDPNPLVAGKGIQMLREAGIDVEEGLLEEEAAALNKRFFTQIQKKRPYVILKWAQTKDGFVARGDYSSKWISNAHSRQLVHRWRAEEDGIMVGTKTAYYDNPRLNTRDWEGKDPVRVVIDKKLTLDNNLHLFDRSQLTICYNLEKDEVEENLSFVKLKQDFGIQDILDDLHSRNIQSLIVEGGSFLLQMFISEGLWDEARVFIGGTRFGSGIPAPLLNQKPEEMRDVMGDLLCLYKNYSSH
jgi:diaminohydroxyphosphoribosylaminopyrimidine deaminase/5-amino-6-(5-phosphoribosylamino)uracil reductase